MTMDGDGGKPPIGRSMLALAQFRTGDAELDVAAIERLTGMSCSTARDCLVDLSRLGYIVSQQEGRYRLAGDCAGVLVHRAGEGGSTRASA
ncbi:MAG TPA: helix-turn-helix domain-containing protein [Solirubrobacteraceae bacterium]